MSVCVSLAACLMLLLAAVSSGAAAAVSVSDPYTEYMQERSHLMTEDIHMRIGGNLVLTAKEKVVSDILTQEKERLVADSCANRTIYYPSQSFFIAKPLIENSTVFKIIKRMPKGGALHLHDTSMTGLDWVIKNATYRDNVYMCINSDHYIMFSVFKTPPKTPDCVWKLVKDERAAAASVAEFDLMLKNNLTMLQTDPIVDYASNALAWVRFLAYFRQLGGLLFYTPIFKDYYWEALKAFRDDGVQYMEWRGALAGLHDLDGIKQDAEYAVKLTKELTEQFVKQYPDFIGAKIIMSGTRSANESTIYEEVKTAMYLNQKYPDYMVGYDLVGDEVFYHSLIYYIKALLYPSMQNPPYHLPYFFHAGETDWEGTSVDDNLVDAILLNTSRIGHGYALPKHPRLMQLVKDRKIPIEVNPISNQVLRLVTDLRNHPMAGLMADNYPIVVSSDDWAVWESAPLSFDMYLAYMAMSGKDVDLTFLKQLAINSLQFSAMNASEKVNAMKLWENQWNKFIDQVIKEFTARPYVVFN